MIGTFFVSLFKINEQADHYWLQAAKLREKKLELRELNPKRRILYEGICADITNALNEQFRKAVRKTGVAFKDLENGMKSFSKRSVELSDAMKDGFTNLSKERRN